MGIVLLALIIILVRAYPENLPWDDSAEGLFPTSNLNLFDDTIPYSTSNTLDDSAFLNGYSPEDDHTVVTIPPLADLNGEPAEDSLTNYNLDFADEGLPMAHLDSSLVDANCGDLSIQTEDPLFNDYVEDPSTNLFAPAIDAEDPSLPITDDRISLENKGTRKGQYVPEKTYDLGPSTGPYTPSWDAVAEDGTPLRFARCPAGKKRTCCSRTDPPFIECWLASMSTPVCQFARNQYCCTGVQSKGGPGIDCENTRWIKARGRAQELNPSEDPQGTSLPNQLQELFPILQDLPDINPPAYCQSRRRRRI